eukprot:g3752.t1
MFSSSSLKRGTKKKNGTTAESKYPLCDIRIRVRNARNLINTDKQKGQGHNIIDPFVVVCVENIPKWQTKLCKNSTNPVWEDTCDCLIGLDIFDSKYVKCVLKDRNSIFSLQGQNQEVGYVDFFLPKLVSDRIREVKSGTKMPSEPTYDRKFEIKPAKWLRKKYPERVEYGTLHLRIDVMPNKACEKKLAALQHKISKNVRDALALKKNKSIRCRGESLSGYLHKIDRDVFGHISRSTRFFEFEPPNLIYYEDNYHYSRDPSFAKRESVRGMIDVGKELVMIRTPQMAGRGVAEFELLHYLPKLRAARSWKLEADTKENAMHWVDVLERHCKLSTKDLIEGAIKSIEIIGVRNLRDKHDPLGKTHVSYSSRVTRDDGRVYERFHRFSEFKNFLNPRVECLFGAGRISESASAPKFPDIHAFNSLNPFGDSKSVVVEKRIQQLQEYVEELLRIGQRRPTETYWWVRRLLVRFFAPKGAEVPLLRYLHRTKVADYSVVKWNLIDRFGLEVFFKYRDDVHLEMRKRNRARTAYTLDSVKGRLSIKENAKRKLQFLDYVTNPFRALEDIGGEIQGLVLEGPMASKLREVQKCKMHGTLLKTSSKSRVWERRWCRIPKDKPATFRRSHDHPFSASFANFTSKTKNISLVGARVVMGRTLWSEELRMCPEMSRTDWPPTPFWFKLLVRDGGSSHVKFKTRYYCTHSKLKLVAWVRGIRSEILAAQQVRDISIHSLNRSSSSSKDSKISPEDKASCTSDKYLVDVLIDRLQGAKTHGDVVEVLDEIIDECKSLGSFEVDAIVDEIYGLFAKSKRLKAIKDADKKRSIILSRILTLERAQGLENSKSVLNSFKKDVVGKSEKQVKEEETKEDEDEESEREHAKERAEANEKLATTMLSPGEWQVHVHIIQFKDLVNTSSVSAIFGGDAKQDMGSVDAVTYVDCLQQSDHTTIKKGVTSGIVDEVLVFRRDVVHVDTLQKEQIRVMICDAHKWGSREHREVGSFTFDLTDVYYRNENHEYYHQWIGLTRGGATEISGYLQVTVTVLGPCDKKIHHRDEDDFDYDFDDTQFGVGDGHNLLMPPNLTKIKRWIALTIYRGEDLPKISSLSCEGLAIHVEFDHETARTRVAKNPQDMFFEVDNCYYNETIWIPILLPTMATNVIFKIYPHFELSGRGAWPLATAHLKLSSILQSNSLAPMWLNLYGAVRNMIEDGIDIVANNHWVSSLRKGLNRCSPHDMALAMATIPPMASTFRGRLLVSAKIAAQPPKNAREVGLSFWRRHSTSKKMRLEDPFKTRAFPVDFGRSLYGARSPSTQRLRLIVQVIAGANLPDTSAFFDLKGVVASTAVAIKRAFTDKDHSKDAPDLRDNAALTSCDTKYFVEVSWGHIDLLDMRHPPVGGRHFLHWSQTLDAGERDVVCDPDQVPDMFVYLVERNGDRNMLDRTRLAYIRIRGRDLVENIGFKNVEAKWNQLKIDKSLSGSRKVFCGSLYLRIGVGTPDQWNAEYNTGKNRREKAQSGLLPHSWRIPKIQLVRYELRLHLFRGRRLLIGDTSGLSDCYVKMTYCGKKVKSPIVRRTVNPNWYSTLFLHVNAPFVGKTKGLASEAILKNLLPPILLRVKDHDAFGRDEELGRCYYHPTQRNIVDDDKELTYRKNVPSPTWHDVTLGDKDAGSLLISCQLCALTSYFEVLTHPPANFLEPPKMRVLMEVVVVGLREIKGRHGERPVKPYVSFSIGGKILSTTPSALPTQRNPNYLVRIQELVDLPVDQIFMPTLHMKAVDCYVGGRIQQTIASYELDLMTKTEWTQSKAGWVQQLFDDRAFDVFDPHSNELDTITINRRIHHARVGYDNFLDALERCKEELVHRLRDRVDIAEYGTDANDEKERIQLVALAKRLVVKNRDEHLKKLSIRYDTMARFVEKFHFADTKQSSINTSVATKSEGEISGMERERGTVVVGADIPKRALITKADEPDETLQNDTVPSSSGGSNATKETIQVDEPSDDLLRRTEARGATNASTNQEDEPIADDHRTSSLPVKDDNEGPGDDNDSCYRTPTYPFEPRDMVVITSKGPHFGVEATLIAKLGPPSTQWIVRLGANSPQGGELTIDESEFERSKDLHLSRMGRKPILEEVKEEEEDSDSDDDYTQKPKYLKNRDGGEGEYINLSEELANVQPFEKFPLARAQHKGSLLSRFFSLFRRSRSVNRLQKRVMGHVKGLVRIRTEFARNLPLSKEEEKWFQPVEVVVRVYVLKAYALRPMSSFFKRVDPYLKIRLGDHVIDDRKNHLSKKINPEFYRAFEIGTTLPGVSRLHVGVWDHNWLLRDSHIGEAVIDLEDRWFCPKWHEWGQEFAVEKAGPNGKPKMRVAPKPVETFTLRNRSFNSGTGDLFAWVDILTKDEARKYPMTNISPPPLHKFQLRVIVWKTRHVPYADAIAHLSDLFCRVYVENGPSPQCTDVHWRCATGKGSFNWRMLIDIDLPHKYPLMRFQIWDQDLVARN